ncbi:Catalyzes the last two steps in the biosynthesis of 5- methylaminomethyl-2-thiouridine (mnm(5)s(2)U) at the wobble position (U34) in tRNA. Catalyzes the FAD-dependent demodification of cmnm(5)s(2)U34 to nm(5)s(2)U34 [Seminavis robusta]|uniref:FAD dependent oxidoreductase domain-containing protein n=1 Tax=Seminavis robusta TaxID=568900 RepID=A0A9N8HES8_9STRA|nr:Catalyzes the last two steps in the biosynthesis of 5- methylaminomethyl-2-thiouridine (mnm(5)s(2)U) at the wobble position (U34) in tRNA. Catalyzes the FAD-dependent demodification of cmnm(5)s(2)U34 to nm(5)s(2)U34 [Seminavis robusta]|eukprot:Sro488_g153100.1 Catalyzes the last two steps in the biosynthesis of 5- methylaminomethyl-2-thiouridine (mnm(5)s(2)U) at the wobble position (U34) in tRNA. Catalyzes the FAD-dependent demodification of cmnm(5)s(2)U34 to nm(5)s(2)U34 (508) ;mRNA; f:32877-34464
MPPDRTFWNDKSASSSTTAISASKDRSPLSGDTRHHYSYVIVGSGMAGLHTALALAERQQSKGGNILLLDAHSIGQSASGKSKGLVVPGIQVPEKDLARICGSTHIAKQVYDLTHKAAIRLKEDIVERYKIDCDWVDAGLVEASLYKHNDSHQDEECHPLTAAETRQLLGQPNTSTLYKSGEYDPSCSGVDPLALTRGLATVLENQWNVRICEQTKVTTIDAIPTLPPDEASNRTETNPASKYVVTTEAGAQIECQHVVLCTGPELVSRKLSKQLANAIIPIYTWMASTVPLNEQCPLKDGVIDTILPPDVSLDDREKEKKEQQQPTPAPLCGDDFVSLNYWRRSKDSRILFGSLADAYPIPQWLAEYRLRNSLHQVYPQLQNVPFDHIWSGRLAFPRDAIPLIGRDEGYDHHDNTSTNPTDGGVWYATGFGGHGIVPTVMAGTILADAILGVGNKDTWQLFQWEFPPKYSFWPVSRLGAQAILMTYSLTDWLRLKGVPIPRLPKPW